MNLIGDILEHEIVAPVAPTGSSARGFPETGKLKKISRWKLTRQKVTTDADSKDEAKEAVADNSDLSEAQKIHLENVEKMASMTNEEITKEREELLSSLDPELVRSLLKRTDMKLKEDKAPAHDHSHDENHVHAEGYNGWIGGMKNADGMTDISQMDKEEVDKVLGITNEDSDIQDVPLENDKFGKPKKTVSFAEVATVKYEDLNEEVVLDEDGWEDVHELNDMIPNTNMPNYEDGADDAFADDGYQIGADDQQFEEKIGVHFTKPKQPNQDSELDLNDPEFYNKLHDKYYPDLPKETAKLSWMVEPLPQQISTTYESISDMRFDFKGNLVELRNEQIEDSSTETPTYLGLHHHSDNPQLPGYTLAELAHLSRSVMPGQRCISIQTLGRILHKLGLHKYNILPITKNEEDKFVNDQMKEMMGKFEEMMWDLTEQLKVIETIQDAADEGKTRNMSVRNYALEALWLWKQGGGRVEKETEEEEIIRALQPST